MKNCVVVLNYNDYANTFDFVNAIKNYKIIDLIVIVDNCSSDNSYLLLKKIQNDKIVVIQTMQNKGYNYGNNMGCKYILDKYKRANILISNPDVIVKENVIKEMIKTLNNNEDYVVCAPTIIQNNAIEKGWKIPSPLAESILSLPGIYRICKKNIRKNNIRFYDENYYTTSVSIVDAITGCFFLIKGDFLKKIGFFDEMVFLYGEEDILGVQVKRLNKKIVLLNNCSVIHNHSQSINKSFNSFQKAKIAFKSKLYFQKIYNNTNFIQNVILYLCGSIRLSIEYIKYKLKK